jgi:hypothetical protein
MAREPYEYDETTADTGLVGPEGRETKIPGRWRPLACCTNSVQGRTVKVSMATFVPSDLGREVPSTTMRISC